jgi:hypothetical protein
MAAVDDKGKGKGKECDRMGNFWARHTLAVIMY